MTTDLTTRGSPHCTRCALLTEHLLASSVIRRLKTRRHFHFFTQAVYLWTNRSVGRWFFLGADWSVDFRPTKDRGKGTLTSLIIWYIITPVIISYSYTSYIYPNISPSYVVVLSLTLIFFFMLLFVSFLVNPCTKHVTKKNLLLFSFFFQDYYKWMDYKVLLNQKTQLQVMHSREIKLRPN